ncbi:tetratricopeptide repeat protein [Pelagicoccus sp. SDUM812002]|uniref:tetratricopeptide repeat protein n=1 Tax=Pelagicoccus sp. SDUM812002 TaxID=3041266 RepID=UPI00280D9660|nr:tetratricopeptide repeat protein [Pelagicoccus sp. SDUM812002]MDQ8184902.1 tetratricopeptide repeat protein [Pelagicoccus sp. SDUM812002]
MIRSFLNRISPSFLLPLIAVISVTAQDFDYGEMELSPTELYDEALQHLYGIDGYKPSRPDAMSRLKKAAERGFAPAHNMLGLLYLEGNGFFSSPRKALRSFEQAAELGDALGQYNAGYSYLAGRGTPVDNAKAAELLLAVVDDSTSKNLSPDDFGTVRNARASAYFYLGLIYGDEDDVVHFDNKKATEMFLQADRLNEPSAAMILAIRYARGEGVEQDQDKSLSYLERFKVAAVNKMHNSYSQTYFQGMDRQAINESLNRLVANYEDQMTKRIQTMQTSFGVSLLDEEDLFDPAQAFVWLESVAVKENPLACSRIANLYYQGEGTEQNFPKARELLELAHKQNTMAKYNLGVMLINGQGGPADPERGATLIDRAAKSSWYPAIHYKNPADARFITEREAIKLVTTEADNKNPDALYCLGRRKLFGLGMDSDFENAKTLILQAAELGNAQARYFYGVYVAKDFAWLGATEEDKAIQAAADAGYPPAIHHLGQKAEQNARYKIAIEHYKKAASLGHIESLYKIGKFYRDANGVQRDYPTALSYFRQAAENEDAIGALNLGIAYEYGHGVEIDAPKAYQLYQEALDLGSYYAEFTLGNLLASGKLGERAWEEAIAHWEQAAEYRIRGAFIRLGDAYRDGSGVPQNISMAENYYAQSSRLSYYPDERTNLRTWILSLRFPDKTRSFPTAILDIRAQELGGYPLAGYELAFMNLDGVGLKQNDKKAYKKFLKAAKLVGSELKTRLGDSYEKYYGSTDELKDREIPVIFEDEELISAGLESCYQIAKLLLQGKVNKTKPEDSIPWFQTAAALGHEKAQFELGRMYLNGKYVETNVGEAWRWILESATLLPEAKHFAAARHFDGTYPTLTQERAVKLLRDAATAGHKASQELLEEKGIPIDPDSEPPHREIDPKRKGEDDGFDGAIDLDVA